MSFDGMSGGNGAVTDRLLYLIDQSGQHKHVLYRTLNLPKGGVRSVYKIEQLNLLPLISHPQRQKTIHKIIEVFTNTLISTSSLNGWNMDKLTETKVRQINEDVSSQKKGLFGGQS